MASVAQFLALGGPVNFPNQQEWIFDLPDNLDVRRAGVLLFRINPINSPRVEILINNVRVLDRRYDAGMTVSYHVRIPSNVLRPGQNQLLFHHNRIDDIEGGPSGTSNMGDPVVYYHVSFPNLGVLGVQDEAESGQAK